jgi:hypothetical protein
MTNNEMPSSDVSTWPDIYFVEALQIAIAIKEDNVKDVNDDNIFMEMNRQVLMEELSPPRAKLNYNRRFFSLCNVQFIYVAT